MEQSVFVVEEATNNYEYSFYFDLNEDQDFLQISTLFFPQRMYSQGCYSGYNTAKIELYSGFTRLDYVWTNDMSGIVSLTTAGLAAGTYRIDVTPGYNSISANVFTLAVYTYESVTITDWNGETSTTGWWGN